jgi:hypothetical protein
MFAEFTLTESADNSEDVMGMGDRPPPPPPPQPPPVPGERHLFPSTATWRLVSFIIVVAAATASYRVVYATGHQRSAALFVGVPTVLAVGLAFVPRQASAIAMLLKGSLLAMLIAGIILPEGLICLALAYPLVAVVAVALGAAIDATRHENRRRGMMAVTLPLLLASLEGVTGSPFDAHDHAVATATVAAPAAAVADALADPTTFPTDLPLFLTFGFNRPVGSTGAGIEVGDHRTIDFTGGTHDDHPLRVLGGSGGRSSDHHAPMDLTVVESRPGRVVFAVDHDGTMLARWVDLERAVVTWEAIDAATTRVTWQLDYERLLYPTAYFAPLQRYGMDRAAGYLLSSVVVDHVCQPERAA